MIARQWRLSTDAEGGLGKRAFRARCGVSSSVAQPRLSQSEGSAFAARIPHTEISDGTSVMKAISLQRLDVRSPRAASMSSAADMRFHYGDGAELSSGSIHSAGNESSKILVPAVLSR